MIQYVKKKHIKLPGRKILLNKAAKREKKNLSLYAFRRH